MDSVDVLLAAAAVLLLVVLGLLLEVALVLGVLNVVRILDLTDVGSWFLHPSSHLPPSSALAFLLRTGLPVSVARLSLHCLSPCRCYSLLYSQAAAVVQNRTGVPVLSPCQAQAAHLQWLGHWAHPTPFPL